MTEPSGLRDSMSEQPSNDPFEECELSPDAILGTHTFEDVISLFEERIRQLLHSPRSMAGQIFMANPSH